MNAYPSSSTVEVTIDQPMNEYDSLSADWDDQEFSSEFESGHDFHELFGNDAYSEFERYLYSMSEVDSTETEGDDIIAYVYPDDVQKFIDKIAAIKSWKEAFNLSHIELSREEISDSCYYKISLHNQNGELGYVETFCEGDDDDDDDDVEDEDQRPIENDFIDLDPPSSKKVVSATQSAQEIAAREAAAWLCNNLNIPCKEYM